MRTVPLGKLLKKANAPRARDERYPLLSMTMHDGLIEQSRKFKKRVASRDTSDYKVVTQGQLVVGFPIDEAVLDFQMEYPSALLSPAYGIWDLADESTTDRSYLTRYLRSPRAVAYYKAKLRGSTARRRSLPEQDFLGHPIPSQASTSSAASLTSSTAPTRSGRSAARSSLTSTPSPSPSSTTCLVTRSRTPNASCH